MTELCASLISQAKNFWQYICIGITLLVFNFYEFDNTEMVGYIFISLAIATILGNITNIIKLKYIAGKEKKSQQKQIEQQKGRIITEYNNLSSIEKEIIDYCLNEKILSYEDNQIGNYDYTLAIYSLVERGMGKNITSGCEFLMNKFCFDILLEYKKTINNQNIEG